MQEHHPDRDGDGPQPPEGDTAAEGDDDFPAAGSSEQASGPAAPGGFAIPLDPYNTAADGVHDHDRTPQPGPPSEPSGQEHGVSPPPAGPSPRDTGSDRGPFEPRTQEHGTSPPSPPDAPTDAFPNVSRQPPHSEPDEEPPPHDTTELRVGRGPDETPDQPHPPARSGTPAAGSSAPPNPPTATPAEPPSTPPGNSPRAGGPPPDVFSDIYPKQPKRGYRGRGMLIAGLALGTLLVLSGGGYAYIALLGGSGADSQPAAASSTGEGASATSATPAAPTTPAQPHFDAGKVRNAKVDPRPLTLSEQFARKKVQVNGRTMKRVAMNKAKRCGKATGRGFKKRLRKADCTRVLRATHVDGKYAVTTGVAVLPTKAAATRVEKVANPKKQVWFKALPGPQGSPAADIRRSGGYSTSKVVGRYLVFSFAAYANKRKVGPQSQDLSEMCEAMLDHAGAPIVARGMVTPQPRR